MKSTRFSFSLALAAAVLLAAAPAQAQSSQPDWRPHMDQLAQTAAAQIVASNCSNAAMTQARFRMGQAALIQSEAVSVPAYLVSDYAYKATDRHLLSTSHECVQHLALAPPRMQAH